MTENRDKIWAEKFKIFSSYLHKKSYFESKWFYVFLFLIFGMSKHIFRLIFVIYHQIYNKDTTKIKSWIFAIFGGKLHFWQYIQLLNSRCSHFSWQSWRDRCSGIIVYNGRQLTNVPTISLRHLFSFTPANTDIFLSDVWMLPTLGQVWQMHWGFVKPSLCISDKCYVCWLEQIQTLQEIQSETLTNP